MTERANTHTDRLTGLPDTKVGTFSRKLYDYALANGWIVISMKKDWKRIFPFDP